MIYHPPRTDHDLVSVDLFAGGGGASEGIRLALGQAPCVAINHDPAAIKMHAANHPGTLHLCESVFDVEPFTPRGRLDLLWASPDCTHHSRARGGKPRKQEIRALADIVIPWAREARPAVIIVENVAEFEHWGPLDEHDKPIKARRGEDFQRWVGALRDLGYVVEWHPLIAADFGAPTTRKRLFIVARCDGLPIVWPEPTHGPGRPLPYRAAAECIDWTIPCPSIFLTKAEAKAQGLRCKRPLADKTMARIAAGVKRYVLEDNNPYIHPIAAVRQHAHEVVGGILDEHSDAIDKALAAPVLIHSGNGERKGQRPRTYDIRNPLGTVVACGQRHALVAAFLAKHNKGATGQPLRDPMHTIMAVDQKSLVAAHLIHHRGQSIGRAAHQPAPTITATGQGHLGLLATHLTKFYGTSTGSDLRDPAPVTTAQGNHAGLVAALLCKYYGSDKHGQSIRDPLHTIPTSDRFGLVTVHLDGEPYVIADIGMRMLQPRELATAQGFGPEYILTGNKTEQVARIGNSVSPHPARALVEAQFYGGAREGQLQMFAGAA